MVFSSHLFMFYFLPAVLLCYYIMPRRGKNLLLTLLSYAFYGWANPLFTLLMLLSTGIDYVCGLVMSGSPWVGEVAQLEEGGARSRRQKIAVTVSICSNLGLLGFFKYFNFGADSYDSIVNAIGLPGLQLDLAFRITLPLGISFYTFQSMSYTIDVYRGRARAVRNVIDFACFVSLFSQLVAGPIIRFTEVADQLRGRTHSLEKFARGAAFLSLGLTKKVLLANPCGKIADMAFGHRLIETTDAWFGAVAYSFQIYFDFSAYSDMAIGLGLMFGFMFAKNFNSPYSSQSITEFWQRWHISLSTWLKDYLYIPLGGNKLSPRRTYVNLAIVMLLGGLWHGAAWNFVVWGGIHGAFLAIERAHGKKSFYSRVPKLLRMAITFLIVTVAWVFFRADDLQHALSYCGSMLGLVNAQESAFIIQGIIHRPYYLFSFLVCAGVTWSCPQVWDWTRKIGWVKAALIVLALWVSIVMLTTQGFNPFIYFIF